MSTTSEESIPVAQKFEAMVLNLMASPSDPIPKLTPLKKSLNYEGVNDQYFEQFIPFLQTEIYDSAKQEKESILLTSKRPFLVQGPHQENLLNAKDKAIYEEQNLVKLKLTTMKKALPKLDHGFYFELCFIMLNYNSKRPLKENISRGIYCLAKTSLLPKRLSRGKGHSLADDDEADLDGALFDDDDEDNPGKNYEMSFDAIIRKSDEETLLTMLAENENKLHVFWLGGLIPMCRMYEACVLKAEVAFEDEFIHNEVPHWPEDDNEIALTHRPKNPLNARQEEILRGMLSTCSTGPQGMYIIVGPPGTGKTTLANNWLCNYLKKYPNHRILITAPSNQAVKVLLQAAMKDITHNQLAWLGVAAKLDENMVNVSIQGFVKHIITDINQEKKWLQKNVRKFEQNPRTQLPTRAKLEALSTVIRSLNQHIQGLTHVNSSIPIKRYILRDIKELKMDIAEKTIDFEELLQSYYEIPVVERAKCVETLKEILQEVYSFINTIVDNRYLIENYLLQRAQVVFTTLVSSGRPYLSKQISGFDIVLVDEAAQALIPEIFIPMKFKPQAMFLIGDPQQLPATIASQRCKQLEFENSLMHWLIMDLKSPHKMLNVQYRMHPEICEWISNKYYDGQLTTPDAIRDRTSLLLSNPKLSRYEVPLLTSPVLWFDIEGQEIKGELHGRNMSTYNEIEAMAVIRTVVFLLTECRYTLSQIGIISFYAEQIRVLSRLFDLYYLKPLFDRETRSIGESTTKQTFAEWKKSHRLDIKTVDGYQGGEKDIILVSMVRTISSVGFLNDSRRLNVAMSRARHAHWVFGHFSQLLNCNVADVRDFASHHQPMNVIHFMSNLHERFPSFM